MCFYSNINISVSLKQMSSGSRYASFSAPYKPAYPGSHTQSRSSSLPRGDELCCGQCSSVSLKQMSSGSHARQGLA
jgi:hypothetical protein